MQRGIRIRFPWHLVGIAAVIALGFTACGGGGGGGKAPAALTSATYVDANENGMVDANDRLILRFSKPVLFTGGINASSVLTLSNGMVDSFGGAILTNGASNQEILIVATASTSFEPNGTHPAPNSTGIDLLSGQTDIAQDKKGTPGKPVVSRGVKDIEGLI